MRTTVTIEESLLVSAKEVAARSHRSLSDVINDALRMLLAERPEVRRRSVRLPTFGGSGLQPGVDLEDKDALAALLDDGEARARAAG
jgi:Arc/MetJ-type ribon-helix-helix transcriptional regulator